MVVVIIIGGIVIFFGSFVFALIGMMVGFNIKRHLGAMIGMAVGALIASIGMMVGGAQIIESILR